MAAEKKCCVPGCGFESETLHKFPNPDKDIDRFRSWIFNIRGEISRKDDQYIYKYRRVCHLHFEVKYHTWSKFLSPDAVPTLNLRSTKEYPLHKFPNPERKVLFNTWVYAIGGDMLQLKNEHIFKYRRVCHLHFEEKYLCRNNRLSHIAVPTKNMPGVNQITLHSFPNPEKEPDRFRSWVYAVKGDILALDNQVIYEKRRVCHNHFESKFCTWTKTLTPNAIPTLHLPDEEHNYSNIKSKNGKMPLLQRELNQEYTAEEEMPVANEVPAPNSSQELESASRKLSCSIGSWYTCPGINDNISFNRNLRSLPTNTCEIKIENVNRNKDDPIFNPPPNPSPTKEPRNYSPPLPQSPPSPPPPPIELIEGPFSWQTDETKIPCIDDDDDAKVPTATPFEGEVTSQVEEYRRCTNCRQLITGMRFVCLQCVDCELCPECEAKGDHDTHYVMRAPEGATHLCVEAMAEGARRALAQFQLLIPEDLVIKTEVEGDLEELEETEDPIAFSRAPSVAETHTTQQNNEVVPVSSDDESDVPQGDLNDIDATEYSEHPPKKKQKHSNEPTINNKLFVLCLERDSSGKIMTKLQPAEDDSDFRKRKGYINIDSDKTISQQGFKELHSVRTYRNTRKKPRTDLSKCDIRIKPPAKTFSHNEVIATSKNIQSAVHNPRPLGITQGEEGIKRISLTLSKKNFVKVKDNLTYVKFKI